MGTKTAIGWVVPLPRMQSWQMKVYRDSLQKIVNPGGDWHPGKGDSPGFWRFVARFGGSVQSLQVAPSTPEPTKSLTDGY